MDEHGVITAHGPFQGLDRFEAPARGGGGAARGRAGRGEVRAVRARGRPLQPLRHHGRAAPVAAVVRPRRPAGQGARDAVRDGRVRLHPPEMNARYFGWVDNIHDWCISRQLWWGHRIPGLVRTERRDASAVGPDERAAGGLDARIRTCSTPGSPPRCGRSPRSAGPTTPPDLRTLLPDQRARHRLRHPVLLGRADDDVRPVRDARQGRPSRAVPRTSPCTAWSATSTARRCPSRAATPSIRWTGWTGSAPTRPGTPWPAGPTRAATSPSARSGRPGSRNFCNKLWNAVRFALLNGAHVQQAPPLAGALSVPDRWICPGCPP